MIASSTTALDKLADYVRQCTMVTPVTRYPFMAIFHPDITRFPGRALWVVAPDLLPDSTQTVNSWLKPNLEKLIKAAALESGQNPSSPTEEIENARKGLAARPTAEECDDDICGGEGLAKRFDVLVEHIRLPVPAA